MSTRMPPRGRAPQRQPAKPPDRIEEARIYGAGGRRRVFDFIIFAVIIALVAVFARELTGALCRNRPAQR